MDKTQLAVEFSSWRFREIGCGLVCLHGRGGEWARTLPRVDGRPDTHAMAAVEGSALVSSQGPGFAIRPGRVARGKTTRSSARCAAFPWKSAERCRGRPYSPFNKAKENGLRNRKDKKRDH